MSQKIALYGVLFLLFLGMACEKDPTGDDGDKKVETGWSALPLTVTDRKVQCIAIHPDHPNTLYVGLFDGLYKSTDGGTNWKSITNGLISRDIKSVEIVVDRPQLVYCGSMGFGISRSEDGGENWINLKGEVANTHIHQVHLVNQRDDVIWLATTTGIYRKAKTEANWISTFDSSRLIHAVISLPRQPTTLLAGMLYTGFLRTTNNGGRWYYVNNGISGTGTFYDCAVQFGFAGADSSLVYAATIDGNFYVSLSGGQDWQQSFWSEGRSEGVALVTHPKLRDRLYLATQHKVFRSMDRGSQWQEMGLHMPVVTITALQVAVGDPGVVFIGTKNNGLYQYIEYQ